MYIVYTTWRFFRLSRWSARLSRSAVKCRCSAQRRSRRGAGGKRPGSLRRGRLRRKLGKDQTRRNFEHFRILHAWESVEGTKRKGLSCIGLGLHRMPFSDLELHSSHSFALPTTVHAYLVQHEEGSAFFSLVDSCHFVRTHDRLFLRPICRRGVRGR